MVATCAPCLGADVNHARISSVRLDNDILMDKNSWGLTLQAGFDGKRDRNWSISLGMKKVQARSNLSMAGEQVSRVTLDPVLFGVGVGHCF